MSERPFMQLYVSDYLGDTRHLSCEQHGAYLLLLMTMWNAGGSLPDDDAKLARCACLSLKKWKAIRPDIEPFFDVADDAWTNKRLTEEFQKSESKSQSRASAGARGGAAKALKDKEMALANATDLPQHSPDTIYKTPKSPSSEKLRKTAAVAASIEILSNEKFDELRRTFPRRDGGHPLRPAVKAWNAAIRSGNSPDRILAAAKAYGVEQQRKGNIGSSYVKMLGPWINLRTFETANIDDMPHKSPADPRQIVLSYDTPPADRARYFIETGRWPQLWGDKPGEEFCFLPKPLIAQCLGARRIAA